MTSLIDVIFLLLLFFMLSSTFSRFSDVELQTSSGQGVVSEQKNLIFVKLDSNQVSLNGQRVMAANLTDQIKRLSEQNNPSTIILAVNEAVSAQNFVDILTMLQAVTGIRLQVVL